MSGTVCAIRGGPESQVTIGRAMSLAQSSGGPLHLLYVVNLEFLARTSSSRIPAISAEMERLGELVLLAAQTKAAARGISAMTHVRHGTVGDQIIALCQEVGARYVVAGLPKQHDESLLRPSLVQKLAQRLRDETRATVVLAEEEHQ